MRPCIKVADHIRANIQYVVRGAHIMAHIMAHMQYVVPGAHT
jgi:hypothetical protein